PPLHPPQLFARLSRQPLARSRVDGRLFNPAADRRLAEVHLPTNRRDRPVTPLHQGNDLRLERGRERSPWSATRPLLLHLLPHSNTLLVGLRPHLGCSPVGGKAKVPLPLLDVLTDTCTAFFSLCLDAGQQVLRTMMEQDRERLCGPKHVPNSARRAVRGGSTRGEVTLGGRRIRVPRLRARSVDGHELELPSFLYAAGRDPLDARTLQAIAIGITTRKYHRTLDPLPTGTRKRAVSKSSVSRHFVALTSAQLTTWLARPLADLEVRSVFLDGLHFRDHVILLRAGRGFPGPEARPRPARGDDRERDRLQGPAGRPARPGGSTASAQCSSSSTAGPASARHCARRVAPTAVVQRCQVHKRRTVLAHLPEAMRPRVCRALAEAYELADVTLANRRLLQLAAGLDHTHPGAAASLREGLDETLTRPRLGVTGALYRTLRIPTA